MLPAQVRIQPPCLKSIRLMADKYFGGVMRWGLPVACLMMLMLGCGGGPPEDSRPVGFVNQTHHSDAALLAIWQSAQQHLEQKIDLNPVQPDAPPRILAGDSRALSVMPAHLTVAPEPDVSSQALFTATGLERSDPTGMIACPQPCDARYATAYSRYQPATTRYAASWEVREEDFDTILEYEFENQILFVLGYDMKWR